MQKPRLTARDCCIISLFTISLILYMSTIAPGIYWRDSPEFVTTAFELGISHPSGSPLFSSIANIFTYLPFGSVAFRVNLVSAVFCSITITVFFLTLHELLNILDIGTEKIRLAVSLCISASLAFSSSFWNLAVVTEVYAMQYFFVIVLFYLLAKVHSHGDARFFLLLSFILGISTGAHIIMLMYLPAVILSIFLLRRDLLLKPHFISYFIFFLILGGSVYIYLPIRSTAGIYWNWGSPDTFKRFLSHVTDQKDAGYHYRITLKALIETFMIYLGFLWKDLSLTGIILAFAGGFYAIKKRWKIPFSLAALVFFQWFFFIRYWHWSNQYVPSFMVLFIFAGIGLAVIVSAILSRFEKSTLNLKPVIILLMLVQLCFNAYINGRENDKSEYWAPRDFFQSIINSIDDGAIVFSQRSLFGLSYLANVEGARPTISHLNPADIFAASTFNRLKRVRYPLLKLGENSTEDGTQFLSDNADRKLYWEPSVGNDWMIKTLMVPNGLFFILDGNPVPLTRKNWSKHDNEVRFFLNREYTDNGPFQDENEKEIVSMILKGIAIQGLNRGDLKRSLKLLHALENFSQYTDQMANSIGAAYANMGKFTSAELYFKKALDINPESVDTMKNLARLYTDTGKTDKAYEIYETIRNISPGDLTAR